MKGTGIAPFVLLAWFGTGSAATIGCQSHAPASTPSHSAASPGLPDDGMVDVGGGVSLHVHCVGAGSPMVLLEGCLGCQVMSIYRPIWSDIGRFTRACRYDRAGAGYSSPAPKPAACPGARPRTLGRGPAHVRAAARRHASGGPLGARK
jgi:hypothetical protein